MPKSLTLFCLISVKSPLNELPGVCQRAGNEVGTANSEPA